MKKRSQKVWNNTAGTGTPATYLKYLYDGWNLIAELDGNNSLVRSYTWGLDLSGTAQEAGGVGGLLMVNAGSGGVHFPAHDLNGNVMGLVNAADGNISAKYEYGPFGEVFCSVGDMAKVNPFGFSTQYTDSETDLVYYGYRYYSPALGRWLSRDPIEEKGGLNLYGFVNNDPVNKWDKLGLIDWFWPFNSRICNNSSDQCLIVWNDKTGYSLLKPGKCTSRWRDRGDFAYWNGDWFKCKGGYTCWIDDRPINKYPYSKVYIPPVNQTENDWRPSSPNRILCKQYCDCNAKSIRRYEFRDQCDCLTKCTEGKL